MKKPLVLIVLSSIIFLNGCSTKPSNLSTAYVSPMKYNRYDCEQVAMETNSVERKVTGLYSSLDSKATKDAWKMGVGLVLFWPALLFLDGGDGPQAVEYSQLKGDLNALKDVSIAKKCGIDFSNKTPEALAEKYKKAKEAS